MCVLASTYSNRSMGGGGQVVPLHTLSTAHPCPLCLVQEWPLVGHSEVQLSCSRGGREGRAVAAALCCHNPACASSLCAFELREQPLLACSCARTTRGRPLVIVHTSTHSSRSVGGGGQVVPLHTMLAAPPCYLCLVQE